MTLHEKIVLIYPLLTDKDFSPSTGTTDRDFTTTIRLQNDSDGKGDYIAAWDHPTLARPTEEQLA